MSFKNVLCICLVVVSITLGLRDATAQTSIWADPDMEGLVTTEVQVPLIVANDDYDLFALGILVSGRIQLSEKYRLQIGLPFYVISHSKIPIPALRGSLVGSTSLELGGVFVGLESGKPDKLVTIFGIRLPNYSYGSYVGPQVSSATDPLRANALFPDNLGLSAHMQTNGNKKDDLSGLLRFGLRAWIPLTERANEQESDVFADFEPGLRVNGESFDVLFGVSSNLLITRDNIDILDRIVATLHAGFNLEFGNFKPGVSFNLPLTDNIVGVDGVLGFNLVYAPN